MSRLYSSATPSSEPACTEASSARRHLLRDGLAGAAALALISRNTAAAQAVQVGGAGSLPPKRLDPLLSLVNDATQGFTIEMYAEARARGFTGFLDWQLDHLAIDDSALDARLAPFTTLSMTGQQLWDNYGPGSGGQTGPVIQQLRGAAALRSIYSKRQLFERTVEFWTDHFNIQQSDTADQLLKTVDDREVIRTHAFGRFEDLLRASARSAAMSWYLDNYANVVGNLNENYAREIMELHTVGVDGGYTEQDILPLARVFTGWAFFRPPSGQYGDFRFFPGLHDFGEKTVMGQVIPAGGGVSDGETMITFLANHPSTASFVSRKMIVWFLGYDPDDAFVAQVAGVFLSTGGEIKDVIRAILSPSTLRTFPWVDQLKLKRPFHYIVSMLRATGAQVLAPFGLNERFTIMGQTPYNWPAPDGYPVDQEAWGSAVLPRWQVASDLLSFGVPGVQISSPQLLSLVSGTPWTEIAQRINTVIMGGAMSDLDVAEVQTYLDAQGQSMPTLREGFALAFSSPSYQYYA